MFFIGLSAFCTSFVCWVFKEMESLITCAVVVHICLVRSLSVGVTCDSSVEQQLVDFVLLWQFCLLFPLRYPAVWFSLNHFWTVCLCWVFVLCSKYYVGLARSLAWSSGHHQLCIPGVTELPFGTFDELERSQRRWLLCSSLTASATSTFTEAIR